MNSNEVNPSIQLGLFKKEEIESSAGDFIAAEKGKKSIKGKKINYKL